MTQKKRPKTEDEEMVVEYDQEAVRDPNPNGDDSIREEVEAEEQEIYGDAVHPYVDEEEDRRSHTVEDLFPTEEKQRGKGHLTMVSRTSAHMASHLIRMRLASEAMKTDRRKSLLEVMIEETDRRSISIRGEGRKEYIEANRQKSSEDDADVIEI